MNKLIIKTNEKRAKVSELKLFLSKLNLKKKKNIIKDNMKNRKFFGIALFFVVVSDIGE